MPRRSWSARVCSLSKLCLNELICSGAPRTDPSIARRSASSGWTPGPGSSAGIIIELYCSPMLFSCDCLNLLRGKAPLLDADAMAGLW
eukprot:3346945-Prymnesium_polylepis.1